MGLQRELIRRLPGCRAVGIVCAISFCVQAFAGHDEFSSSSGGGATSPSGTVGYSHVSPNCIGEASYLSPNNSTASFATCTGEISMIFEWGPDNLSGTQTPDSNDKPPETLVIEEYCDAQYEADPMVGTGTGSCDNGMGSPLVETGMGNVVAGYRAGRRVRSLAGGQQVTVTFSPSASASCATAGRCSARVDYQCRVLAPIVTLSGYTHFDTGDKFLTGQEIKARAVLAPSDPNVVLPGLSGVAISSREWLPPTAGVKPFKDYDPSLTANQYSSFLPADYVAEKLNIFTAKDGKVQVKCKLNIVDPDGSVEVMAQSRVVLSVKPTIVQELRRGVVNRYSLNGSDGFGPTGGLNNSGVNWTSEFNDIPEFGKVGVACFVQLGTFSRSMTRVLTSNAPISPAPPTLFEVDPQNGLEWLDVKFAYPFRFNSPIQTSGIYPIDPAQNSPAGAPPSGSDSPFMLLDYNAGDNWTRYWSSANANESFRVFTMYLPPNVVDHRVRWVPISRQDWVWSEGDTRGEEEEWTITGIVIPGPAQNPVDLHPTWVRRMPWAGIHLIGKF